MIEIEGHDHANMRKVYKNYQITKEKDAKDFEEISKLAKDVEITALNNTLDKLELRITV